MERGGSDSSNPVIGEVGLVALTSAASVVLRKLPRTARLSASLAVAGTAVGLARRHDASWTDLGMDLGDVGGGIRWGVGVGTAVAAAIGVATRWPSVRDRFVDERVAAHSPARAVYELFARIPFETALAEEVLFRGSLLGIGLSRRSTPAALAVSSGLFGLWHVVPTWQDMSASAVGAAAGDGPAARAGAVAGVVVATSAAGAAFGLLRLRSRSVLAPVIVHATLNQVSFSVARSAARAAAARAMSAPGTDTTGEATDR